MSFREVREELRQTLSGAEAMRARLRIAHANLPAAPEDIGTEDYNRHPEGTSGLRIAIEGLLSDHLEPLLRALRAALEIPESEGDE